MAADITYSPKTYRRAGGDETVIADGGKLQVSVDHRLPAEAAPMPPIRGRGSPRRFRLVIY